MFMPLLQLLALTMDNATNNNDAATTLEGLLAEKGIVWQATDYRIRCFARVLHLAVRAECEVLGMNVKRNKRLPPSELEEEEEEMPDDVMEGEGSEQVEEEGDVYLEAEEWANVDNDGEELEIASVDGVAGKACLIKVPSRLIFLCFVTLLTFYTSAASDYQQSHP